MIKDIVYLLKDYKTIDWIVDNNRIIISKTNNKNNLKKSTKKNIMNFRKKLFFLIIDKDLNVTRYCNRDDCPSSCNCDKMPINIKVLNYLFDYYRINCFLEDELIDSYKMYNYKSDLDHIENFLLNLDTTEV